MPDEPSQSSAHFAVHNFWISECCNRHSYSWILSRGHPEELYVCWLSHVRIGIPNQPQKLKIMILAMTRTRKLIEVGVNKSALSSALPWCAKNNWKTCTFPNRQICSNELSASWRFPNRMNFNISVRPFIFLRLPIPWKMIRGWCFFVKKTPVKQSRQHTEGFGRSPVPFNTIQYQKIPKCHYAL